MTGEMLAIGRCSARLIPTPFDLAKVEMLGEANHDRSEFRALYILTLTDMY